MVDGSSGAGKALKGSGGGVNDLSFGNWNPTRDVWGIGNYGINGGGGWHNGEWTQDLAPAEAVKEPVDVFDLHFGVHDRHWGYNGSIDPRDRLQSDRELFDSIDRTLRNTPWSELTLPERTYLNLVDEEFAIKNYNPIQLYHDLKQMLKLDIRKAISEISKLIDSHVHAGMPQCFPAHTPITLASGAVTPIENIAIGDSVLAYATGTSSLTPARVKRLFHNVTEEWIELDWLDLVTGEMRSLTATPGHVMATPEGGFAQLIEMIIPPSVREADFGVEPLVSPRPSGPASRGEREEALTRGQEFGALQSEWQLAA